jgi:hypothetical protein
VHLGYYRGSTGGAWVGRRYVGDRKYRETTIGTADDTQDADGSAVLSYSQAQAKAREWFTVEQRRTAGLEEVPGGPFCVRDAADAYLEWFAEHRKSHNATQRAIEAHILPDLGSIELAKLTTPGSATGIPTSRSNRVGSGPARASRNATGRRRPIPKRCGPDAPRRIGFSPS